MPLVMVGRDMPVSADNWLMPPRPNSSAFCATHSRAWASFIVPRTFSQARSLSGRDFLVAMRA